MKRILDVMLAAILLSVGLVPILLITLAVKLTSKGPVLYWSDRVGRGNKIFKMPKFRTMRTDTPQVASHLLADSETWLTPIGNLLRRSSLDELPQLWSILKGDMSFVGPRPALYNQHDLIAVRTELDVYQLVPGLTGWAQINGRDELPVAIKAEFDSYYLEHRSFLLDCRILFLTLWKAFRREGTAVPPQLLGADTPRGMSQALVDSANASMVKSDYQLAIADYNQALRLDPTDGLAYNLRGKAWLALGDEEKALADFNEAVRRQPQLATAYHNRASLWERRGDYERAIEDHIQAAGLDPEYAVMHKVNDKESFRPISSKSP